MRLHAMGEYGESNLNDVAYIRLLNPLSFLARKDNYELTYDDDYQEYMDSDIFFVQRTWKKNITLEYIEKFIFDIKKMNAKFIYEIDDNLLDLDCISLESKMAIRLMAKNADIIIVSTEQLKQRMAIFNKSIAIIPNFLSLNNIGSKSDYCKETNNRIKIGYFGTFSHQQDFQMILLPLMKILAKYKDCVDFEIVGALSDQSILSQLPNTRIIPLGNNSRYDMFWKWIKRNVNWDIGLAPLKESKFTICKSDIKFLDYAAMGIPGIYSRHPAYCDTIKNGINGIIVENDVEKWEKAIENMILNKRLREKIVLGASNELYDNRILDYNYHLWEDLIINVKDGNRDSFTYK